MRFAYPLLLIFLLIIPLMIYVYRKKERANHIRYSSIDILKSIPLSSRVFIRHAVFILKLLALLFIIIALARPESGFKERIVTSEGLDIMVALDTSGSMNALDFEEEGKNVTRLHIVKK